jgi:sec-independent protein translocase protein TatA
MLRLFDDPLHLVILLAVILIVFGAGKLPGVGSALGQSIREFKKAANEPEDTPGAVAGGRCDKCQTIIPQEAQFCPGCGAPTRPQLAAGSDDVFCSQCGTKNAAAARFCAQCGSGLNVHVG